MEIKVGCCGFAVSQQKYFQLYKLIEIQNTFYQLPRIDTAERWRAAAPPEFEFTLKAWQLITHEPTSPTYRRLTRKIEPNKTRNYGHFRPTDEVISAWQETAAFARALGATLLVFQCPASFLPIPENIANMRSFFRRADPSGFRFVWEPRGKWPEDVIRGLCKDLGLIHCVDPFTAEPLYGDFQYLRLHGLPNYSYRYTDRDLERLKDRAGRKSTYVLFNNKSMRDDSQRLLELLKS